MCVCVYVCKCVYVCVSVCVCVLYEYSFNSQIYAIILSS